MHFGVGNPPALDTMLREHAAEWSRLNPDAKDRRIAELEGRVHVLRAEVRKLNERLDAIMG